MLPPGPTRLPERTEIRPPKTVRKMPMVAPNKKYSYTPPSPLAGKMDPYSSRVMDLALEEHIDLALQREKKRWLREQRTLREKKNPWWMRLLMVLVVFLAVLYVWSSDLLPKFAKYAASILAASIVTWCVCR